ncbi:MAG: glutamate-5-semialdehyde dehydrogenase [Elusimicrobia bacterium]|nr:glutamate-5-semialdehyde dehydrogenase [Candidatus Obscuribacterium magneticum]
MDKLKRQAIKIAQKAKKAGGALALLGTDVKNRGLLKMAGAIRNHKADILKANEKDVRQALKDGQAKAFIDRLTLNDARIEGMAKGLEEIAQLNDPAGEVIREWTRPNGLKLKQIRVPLGVIGMIYESRPNVTAEAAGLCLKAGNAVILRGGSEAYHSNSVLVNAISKAIEEARMPAEAVQLLLPQDRRSIAVLSQLKGLVDLIIARGSEEMINKVSSKAAVPVLGHGKGVCHVYIDEAADAAKAVAIAYNAKVQRPGVCNAMETLLIHTSRLNDVLPRLAERYEEAGVEMRADPEVRKIIPRAKAARSTDWGTEFLDKIVAMKAVGNVQEAIDHINKFGSGHTDSIVTEDPLTAELFEKAVDSSCVMVNASTRLHDGGVFGFGSEIGISTQKLHARGTMGLRELTTTKYLVEGSGQIRE